MKGFWIIVIMIIILVPLFMLSRNSEKSIKMVEDEVVGNEDDMVLPILDEGENVLYETQKRNRNN